MEKLIISLVLSGAGAVLLTLCSLKMLQIYQLSSYKAAGFFGWFKRTKGDYAFRYFSLAFFQFVSLLIFNFSFPDSNLKYLGLILYFGLGAYFVILQKKQKQKSPLKITHRIIRQIVLLVPVYFGLCFLSVFYLFGYGIGHSVIAVVSFFIPLCVTFTHFLAYPLELLINKYYFKKARRKVQAAAEKRLIRIGITGSYGKTTSKNILFAFLSKKYNVLSTPASYNTPMGICKLINGGKLDGCGETGMPPEVFIAEMGARRKGDIKELCDLVMPEHGIITTVGPQHLETFKTMDAVMETKLELALAARSLVVINATDERLTAAAVALSQKTDNETNEKTVKAQFLYAGEKTNAKLNDISTDAEFKDVGVGADGTSFTLAINGESIEIKTILLGRHIPPVISCCALLAYKLGVSLVQIKEAAAELEPVPHRLQLIKTAHGVVIDDAYNSNPQGAKNALEVLGCFEGSKVVITPGFVELGALAEEESRRLGENIAGVADFLISVGNAVLFKGAAEAGMDAERCFMEISLDTAMKRLTSLKLENATVLFLNDLPDNY